MEMTMAQTIVLDAIAGIFAVAILAAGGWLVCKLDDWPGKMENENGNYN
jgi:hypothetical protein